MLTLHLTELFTENIWWVSKTLIGLIITHCVLQGQDSGSAYDTRSRWHNIVLPDIHLQSSFNHDGAHLSNHLLQPLNINQNNFQQLGSYIFFALEPNTKYEVRLQAKNELGWSSFSRDLVFSTRSRGDVPKELPVETLSNDISGNKISLWKHSPPSHIHMLYYFRSENVKYWAGSSLGQSFPGQLYFLFTVSRDFHCSCYAF